MSETTIKAYKELGETPLFCLERVRKEHAINENVPMTYAGRLDPMAEGLMIILVGDECKNKEHYLGLTKTYAFQILVGFSTDTYDLLGKVITTVDSLGEENVLTDSAQKIQSTLSQFNGTFIQKYPRFSSKTVSGKQLFKLALDDDLPEELPEHEVTITQLQCTSTRVVDKEILQKEIIRRIELVKGDFRQEGIVQRWNEVFKDIKQKEFQILSCMANCSSGTYIRQLISDIGEKIGLPMVAYSILRTKIGD